MLWFIASFIAGVVLLNYSLTHARRELERLGAAYVSLALVFGGLYYFIYTKNRGYFVFADEVRRVADIKASVDSQKAVDATLLRIHILDAFLLRFVTSNHLTPAYTWPPENTDWELFDEHFSVRRRVVTRFVGPQHDDPVHSAWLGIRSEKAHLGLEGGAEIEAYISDLPEFTLSGGELLTRLRIQRRSALKDLADSYEVETTQWQAFRVWDFYYFAFTIVGASDIIAATTVVRFLVVLQLFLTFLLPYCTKKDDTTTAE